MKRACAVVMALVAVGFADAAVPSDAGAPADAGVGAAVDVTPFVAPAYTPELGFLVNAGGVLSWNGDATRPDAPRSSLTVVAGASSVGAVLAQARLNSYWRADELRLTTNVDVRDQPDHYFGVGFSSGLTRALGAETTALRRTWWDVQPTLLARVRGALFFGPTADFTGTLVSTASPGVVADPDFARAGPRVVNAGFGFSLSYDTRDVPVNAWRGVLLSASWLAYGPWLGATTQWQALTLDYRQYVTLGRGGSTLAWQLRHRSTWGDVPWSDATQVGTPFDLRAYRWGQYRDRSGTTLLLEYRLMLPFAPGSLWARNGVAVWCGLGALGPGLAPDPTRLLPAVGVGYRLEVQRRITLRLDLGFGREARAFYFNFLEAF